MTIESGLAKKIVSFLIQLNHIFFHFPELFPHLLIVQI